MPKKTTTRKPKTSRTLTELVTAAKPGPMTALAWEDVNSLDSQLSNLRRAATLLELVIVGIGSDGNSVPPEDTGDALTIVVDRIETSERNITAILDGARTRTRGAAGGAR